MSFRPSSWSTDALLILRGLTPDEIDAATKAAPRLREPLLKLWREARLPSEEEHNAKLRQTEGTQVAQQLFDWLTKLSGTRWGTERVHVGVQWGMPV